MDLNAAKQVVKPEKPYTGFRNVVAAYLGCADLSQCFQCGTCSGSCPTMSRMEYGPRKIMHMIHLGMADKVLRSRDLWLCVSCYSCEARCPQGIKITHIMSALRNLSLARGLATDKEAAFSQIFVKVMLERGRMCEPEVLLRYFASKPDLRGIVEMIPLGLRMFLKGKIGLLPQHIENAKEMGFIAQQISGGRAC